jgi:hypothetical protein
VTIPDCISPIIGFRAWTWDTRGLKSLCGQRWHPGLALAARCRASVVVGTIVGRTEAADDAHDAPQARCTCGVYAAKSLEHLRKNRYDRCGIYGEVSLWGTVVEHERGWRAQFAYPKSLILPVDMSLLSTKEVEARLKGLAAYDTDIFIGGDRENIPLFRRGSGFDAAGLNCLTGGWVHAD